MVTNQRWLYAQEYERSYWAKVANRIASGTSEQLNWYAWKASEMEKHLSDYFNEDQKKSARVLEIGSGPIGIVSFLKWGERYTIDPLEDFYSSNSELSKLRDSAVHYAQGNGEQLPFDHKYFTLVIFDNVLDHVHNASSVLVEINRVISKDGLLYLTVNIHTTWGAFLHSILSKLRIDKGHPYTFKLKSIRKFLNKHQFTIKSEKINNYYQARDEDRKSSSLKSRIKGYIGLSEFKYFVVCSKLSPNE